MAGFVYTVQGLSALGDKSIVGGILINDATDHLREALEEERGLASPA